MSTAIEFDEIARGMHLVKFSREYDIAFEAWNAALGRGLHKNADKAFDDDAVDQFSSAMKAKMDKKRLQGRGGWHDRAICSQKQLSNMLLNHVDKGDPVDVGNFAMMLFMRQEKILVPSDPVKPKPDGYAYQYAGPYGGIQFTHGEERNGSKPLREIPYFFDTSPPAALMLSDEYLSAAIISAKKETDNHCEGLSNEPSKEYIDAYFARALLAKAKS